MQKTALHAWHTQHASKMGEFAGYDMPLYYGLGVLKEHLWCRAHAGLFDVSHMGQAMVKGPDALAFVEKITPGNFEKLAIDKTKYTVLLNEEGGIIDDLMITKTGDDSFHFVLNAGCKDKDLDWIKKHLPDSCELTYFDDWALIALQGPQAEQVVRDVLELNLSDLPYMGLWAQDDHKMFISRLGYTGEDGFEISVPNDQAEALWKKLVDHSEVEPIGLAARDSLRLDMGYALYGHDIDDTTSPVEADLNWIIRKSDLNGIGADRITKEKQQGISRKRVGIKLTDKGVAREGSEIFDEDGKKIGTLTSGGYSPTLEQAVGQGYVEAAYAQAGQKLFVNVRGRNIAAEVSKMPFIPAQTKSMKKKAA